MQRAGGWATTTVAERHERLLASYSTLMNLGWCQTSATENFVHGFRSACQIDRRFSSVPAFALTGENCGGMYCCPIATILELLESSRSTVIFPSALFSEVAGS
jgi:hypothetical protein